MKRLLLLFVAACAARTDLGGAHDAAVVTDAAPLVMTGVVLNACAPNDGHEVDLFLALPDAQAPACTEPSVAQGGVRIAIWNSNVDVPGDTLIIGDGSFQSGSFAVACPLGGSLPCTMALHGTFTLTELTVGTMSGSFSLVMPDQTTIAGTFSQITRCNNSTMCG